MNAIVSPHALCGKISAIGSKSFAHRALIAAALLSDKPVEICGITPSGDVSATVGCLRALGTEITEGPNYTVIPPKKFNSVATLPCLESGSTLRFLIPIVAALVVDATFVGSERLLSRPNQPLFDVLQQHGVSVCGYHINGKLTAGDYQIDASVSSQYVTGLLFALSLLKGESRLTLLGETVSKEYVQITLEVLKAFGVKIQNTSAGFVINGQTASAPEKYVVEGDWSNAAFPLVAGAIGGDVTVSGLNLQSCQGDKAICDVLRSANADIAFVDDGVRAKKSNLRAFKVNAEQFPDMVPILSVLAAYADGVTQISGVERLKIKESDRLQGIIEMLNNAGIAAQYKNSVLEIVGGIPHGGKFLASNDHRMAMSQTVLALYAQQSTVIGAECVKKSYPKFFDDINKLGDGCVSLER